MKLFLLFLILLPATSFACESDSECENAKVCISGKCMPPPGGGPGFPNGGGVFTKLFKFEVACQEKTGAVTQTRTVDLYHVKVAL